MFSEKIEILRTKLKTDLIVQAVLLLLAATCICLNKQRYAFIVFYFALGGYRLASAVYHSKQFGMQGRERYFLQLKAHGIIWLAILFLAVCTLFVNLFVVGVMFGGYIELIFPLFSAATYITHTICDLNKLSGERNLKS